MRDSRKNRVNLYFVFSCACLFLNERRDRPYSVISAVAQPIRGLLDREISGERLPSFQ